MLKGSAIAFASAIDPGVDDIQQVVTVAQIEVVQADCGETKDQWGDARVGNG